MAISHKARSRCGKVVSIQAEPPISGAEGLTSWGWRGLSVMTCEENHKRFAYPDLAMRLMDHFADPDAPGLYAHSGPQKFTPSSSSSGVRQMCPKQTLE